MARKDISDLQVLRAYEKSLALRGLSDWREHKWPYEILAEETGEHWKVCYRACERADSRGLINYGTSLRSGWVTGKGRELIVASFLPQESENGSTPTEN
jgi:hypothetical protein